MTEFQNDTMALQMLPEGILRLALVDLDVSEPVQNLLAERGVVTFAELLAAAPGDPELRATEVLETVRTALGRAIDRGLPRLSTIPFSPVDWPSLQGNLLIPLDDEQRSLLRAILGIDQPPVTLLRYARRVGLDLRVVEALAERVRSRLHARARPLITTLQREVHEEFAALQGLLDPRRLLPGRMLYTMAEANEDPWFPLRLAAFCFPHEYHLDGRVLVAAPRRTRRRLLQKMRIAVARHRLPMPFESLLDALDAERKEVPRGVVAYLVRQELRLSIAVTSFGEVLVADRKSPTSRLEALLEEESEPMQLSELIYAYRERHRHATPVRLELRLRRDPTFLLVGPETFGLRRWYTEDLERAAPLADRAVRHVCAEGGKQDVLAWLATQGCPERTRWFVLDLLRGDDRVRLLGRGEACPATQRRSQVMVQLLTDFRKACGDVVESLFVANQPQHRRRLVQRLFAENRVFVRPSSDRVDTLTNYPFNEARLRRLYRLTRKTLEEHGGYAPIDVLVTAVNATDLGGSWLDPLLLEDMLRRQGWFEVLPGHVLALRDRELGAHLLRLARQELRAAGRLVTVEEILRHRPELAEFRDCLGALLGKDPIVQSPDGRRFALV